MFAEAAIACERKELAARHSKERAGWGLDDGGSRRAASTGSCVNEIEWSSRAPRGARGLKHHPVGFELLAASRAPRGARGLKRIEAQLLEQRCLVAPRAGRVD